MAANPESVSAWTASPLTKFRIPRMRRDTVARPALLERLRACTESCPVTLVCAPGGSGKTTLLTQLAAEHAPDAAVLWIGVDEEDNDRHALFGTLLRAVEPLNLAWETAPATLLANSAGSESQTRGRSSSTPCARHPCDASC
jgi:LuxR family transcriptional regulator, maltose regulon positive regulatory protein